MTKSMPNHAVIAAQALIFCYAKPDLVNQYTLIPEALEDCIIMHTPSLRTISINERESIKDCASTIFKFINDTQTGAH